MTPEPLRFSVMLLPNVEWPELLRRARTVEELGFDAIALVDHLTDWAGGTGPWFELWTQLSAIAMATERVRLATLVAQIPLRGPAQLAHQALTADHVSGGRLELGIGTGLGIDPSYRMMGIENWRPGERVDRLDEYVGLVDRLLRGEEVTHAGRFYAAEGAILRPAAVQAPRPPIVIAAMAPRMLAVAAHRADVWNSLSFAGSHAEQLAETAARVEAIDAACAAIGRDPASLRRSYLMFDPTARSSGGAMACYESEAAFARMVGDVTALGIREIGLYYPAAARQVEMFERIARDVIPGLRGG